MATTTFLKNGIKHRKSNPLKEVTIDGVDYQVDVNVNESEFTVGTTVDDAACNNFLQIVENNIITEIISMSYVLPYPDDIDVPDNMRTLTGHYGSLLIEVV